MSRKIASIRSLSAKEMTSKERFFEQLAAGEAEPRAVFDADVAVGRADGQRIDVAVAHHDAFHHGLPADERRGG